MDRDGENGDAAAYHLLYRECLYLKKKLRDELTDWAFHYFVLRLKSLSLLDVMRTIQDARFERTGRRDPEPQPPTGRRFHMFLFKEE